MQATSIAMFRRWSVLSLLNFVIVSILGILLRYKIAFPFPAVNYKFLLHAHSHFAFSGWLSTALFTALVYVLSRCGYPLSKAYTYQFYLAQVASFGMLLSFPFEGYGPVSIFFPPLSILFSWWFAWLYWHDAGRSNLPLPVKRWIRAALLFFVLSGSGPLLLAYSMSHPPFTRGLFQKALYLFLHFQYNGWFSFGVLGLFTYVVHEYRLPWNRKAENWFFGLMATACIPAYCLSLLWMDPPGWIFALATLAAFMQVTGLLIFLLLLRGSRSYWPRMLPFQVRLFWGLSLISFGIKLLLQVLSVIPALGRIAFGFRSVIVAYLHLVMLGLLSFFLMGFFMNQRLLYASPGMRRMGWAAFTGGVLANEILLLGQALAAICGFEWPSSPYWLFAAAVCMFAGLARILIIQFTVKDKPAARLQ